MPLKIVRNDITKMQVDAIVNTASPVVAVGRGTDSAVYEAAGFEELMSARREIGELKPGEAALTPGFRLPSRYIIHAISSPWSSEGADEARKNLERSYAEALRIADEHGFSTIAIPLMATDSYGFPKKEGLDIALSSINRFLLSHEMDIYLVIYDEEAFGLSKKLRADVDAYIDAHYVEEKKKAGAGEYPGNMRAGQAYSNLPPMEEAVLFSAARENKAPEKKPFLPMGKKPSLSPKTAGKRKWLKLSSEARRLNSLDELLKGGEETFKECLSRLIERSGQSDTEVYKGANVSRQVFSKIFCNPGYLPKKKTILSFALSLKLNLDDTRDLLKSAGLTFLPSSKSDIIVQYCIANEIYDVDRVNILLFDHELPTLDE